MAEDPVDKGIPAEDSLEGDGALDDSRSPSTPITRRQFTVGALAMGAAAMLGPQLTSAAFAEGGHAGGGQDGLKIVPTEYYKERMHVVPPYDPNGTCMVLLGAGGGPDAYIHHGCSAAVWSRGSVYLVDFGIGMHRQFFYAGLPPKALRAAFLTHLHSDHMAGAYPFFTESWYFFYPPYTNETPTVKLVGPPSAATNAPPGSNGLPEDGPFLFNPANPTPGTIDMMRAFVEGPYAYDNNLRAIEEGMPDLLGLFGGTPLIDVAEVELPAAANFENTAPEMDPIEVYEDDKVKVTAILVPHGPMFPCLAYRFDTPDGSITFSGDTAAHSNLIKLAHKTDLLVHEAAHVGWIDWMIAGGYPPKMIVHISRAHALHRSVDRPEIGLKADGVGVVAKKAQAKRLVIYHLVPTVDFDAQGRMFDIPPQDWIKEPKKEFGGPVEVGKDLLRIDL